MASLQENVGRLKAFWDKTNVTQRVFVGGLSIAVIVSFFLMLYWLNQPNYSVLYSNLLPEDANRIVETLKAAKEPYQLTNNGSTIMVAQDKVYDLRLQVAGEGGLVGQGVGFEIFDELKVGQTDFVQKINYQRALQGELARTISDFPQVERARVHLVIPTRSLFIEDQRDPSASVVIKLMDGQKIEPEQVESVVNLVSLSVDGLSRERVTVSDMKGNILYKPGDETSLEGMTTSQLEYKLTMQQNLERRIEEMLYPVLGPGAVIAKVNADLDFSQRKIHEEKYDPESGVVLSEKRSEQSTQGRANTEAGVPEANFRGDGIAGALSQQQTSSEQRTTNFEYNKQVSEIMAPVGELDRLSVAVIVDGTYEKDPETGEYVYSPRKEEDVARIRALVQSAVGYDSARGDQIEVSNISFGPPELDDDMSLARMMMEYAGRFGKPVLNTLLIVLFLILVVRPVILALIRPRVEGEVVEGLEGLPEGQDRLALMEAEEDEAEAIDALKKIEDIKAHAVQLSEQNLDQAVGILRHWLKEDGAKVG